MKKKLIDVINSLDYDRSEAIAISSAKSHGFSWQSNIEQVFKAMFDHPFAAPNMEGPSDQSIIESWVKKFINGYNGRPSVRQSNPMGTVADKIIDEMIKSILPNLDDDEVDKIKYGHRLSMSAENVLGIFLEEYISSKLEPYGWYCAWGSTLDKIDFYVPGHVDAPFFQFKNRSNTENSSSSTVRQGTTIQKWCRINALNGDTYWPDLNEIIKSTINNSDNSHQNIALSEDSFAKYVRQAITSNKKSIIVEEDSPYYEGDAQLSIDN
tara:strand:+ start:366 stop:1166 length:801 start_codon:yes stop_codon:yes gene_type:complete